MQCRVVALDVYAGSPEKYTAFATPEAYRAIREYGRTWTNPMQRRPRPEDHLFLATKLLPRKASELAVAKRIHQMATKAGLRDPGSKKGTRFETHLVHGFRRFFNKTCKEVLSGDSPASLIQTRYMMGHAGLVSLDQSHFKTSTLEMAAEYVKVVPDLTMDNTDRLRRSNRTMAANIQRMEDVKDVNLKRMEDEMGRMEDETARREGEKDVVIARMQEEIAERGRGAARPSRTSWPPSSSRRRPTACRRRFWSRPPGWCARCGPRRRT